MPAAYGAHRAHQIFVEIPIFSAKTRKGNVSSRSSTTYFLEDIMKKLLTLTFAAAALCIGFNASACPCHENQDAKPACACQNGGECACAKDGAECKCNKDGGECKCGAECKCNKDGAGCNCGAECKCNKDGAGCGCNKAAADAPKAEDSAAEHPHKNCPNHAKHHAK